MSPALELAALVTLAVLLAAASATAGALWCRVRALPLVRAGMLARDLVERLRALEGLIERLERAERDLKARAGAAASAGPPPGVRPNPPSVRVDGAAEPMPTRPPGPTLIAVPDLSAPPAGPPAVESELMGRFRPVWELADRGAPAEAIARETGLPIGQVELILGLRRRVGAG